MVQTAQICTTLPGHKASVNCTQWLPSNKFAFKGKHSSNLCIRYCFTGKNHCSSSKRLPLSTAKGLDRHYLLSGDSGGVIILWEYSVLEGKVKSCAVALNFCVQ